MSTSKVKSQVRPEQKVRKINKIPQAEAGRASRADGFVPFYATSALPSAANLPNGCLAFDTSVAKLKITASGSWVLAS